MVSQIETKGVNLCMYRLTRKRLNEFKEDIKENYSEYDGKYFSQKYGVSLERVYFWASKLKASRENRFTEDLKNKIFEDYWINKVIAKKIYKKYKIQRDRLKEIIEEKGGNLRSHVEAKDLLPLNEDYFEKINSPQKAYWLGFLYADGNISNQNILQFRLQTRDGYIIENFAKDLESGHSIYKEREGATTGICIRNNKIVEDLNKLGMGHRKTYDLDFPKIGEFIPKKYFDNFLIGFFDGDGCFRLVETKYTSKKTEYKSMNYAFFFGATGVKNFLEDLQKYLFEEYKINSRVFPEKRNKRGLIYDIYTLQNRENYDNFKRFFKNGYRGLSTCLLRKKEVVDKYLKNKGYIPPKRYD